MHAIVRSNKFEKSLRITSKRHLFDRDELEQIVATLAVGIPLDRRYHDHALTGPHKGYRECHLSFDVLLIYRILKDQGIIILENIDSHDRSFRKKH